MQMFLIVVVILIHVNFSLWFALHLAFVALQFYFVPLAHLHVFNTWFYRISSNNVWGSYFKISLAQRAISRGNTTGKNITIIIHFGIFKLSIYKNRLEYRI